MQKIVITVDGKTVTQNVPIPPPKTVTTTTTETKSVATTQTVETTVPVTTTETVATTEQVTTTQPVTTTVAHTVTSPTPGPTVVNDTKPPWAGITRLPCRSPMSFTCRRRQARASAWRRFSGFVHDPNPSSGIRRVEVTLTQRIGRTCLAYSGRSFTTMPCRAAFRLWWPATLEKGKRWSFVVEALSAGRYVVRIRALDRAGNRQRPPARRVFIVRFA